MNPLHLTLTIFITVIQLAGIGPVDEITSHLKANSNPAVVFQQEDVPGAEIPNRQPMGLGMFAPDFFDRKLLGFYGNPNLEKSVNEHLPTDSLAFVKTETGINISYAPPWFVPAIMKLDYDVLYLRTVTIHGEFIEVVVNEASRITTWVDRSAGRLIYWPDFLLTMNSVKQLRPGDNPVKIKPLEHASLVSTEYTFLRPTAIRQQWLQVELTDKNFIKIGTGWIRWQENGSLIISYSLFS